MPISGAFLNNLVDHNAALNISYKLSGTPTEGRCAKYFGPLVQTISLYPDRIVISSGYLEWKIYHNRFAPSLQPDTACYFYPPRRLYCYLFTRVVEDLRHNFYFDNHFRFCLLTSIYLIRDSKVGIDYQQL